MSRSNPSPTLIAEVFAKVKPVDTRPMIPCTELPAEIARLEGAGRKVVGMVRKRDRRNGATHYILDII